VNPNGSFFPQQVYPSLNCRFFGSSFNPTLESLPSLDSIFALEESLKKTYRNSTHQIQAFIESILLLVLDCDSFNFLEELQVAFFQDLVF